jgi:hypothetical protein
MPASMKMTAVWDVVPRSLVEIDHCLKGAYCLMTLMMEAVSTSETLVNFYQTTFIFSTYLT